MNNSTIQNLYRYAGSILCTAVGATAGATDIVTRYGSQAVDLFSQSAPLGAAVGGLVGIALNLAGDKPSLTGALKSGFVGTAVGATGPVALAAGMGFAVGMAVDELAYKPLQRAYNRFHGSKAPANIPG